MFQYDGPSLEDGFLFLDEPVEEDPEEELSEEELLLEQQEVMLSQKQGDWLDGYLDAMDELEEEVF